MYLEVVVVCNSMEKKLVNLHPYQVVFVPFHTNLLAFDTAYKANHHLVVAMKILSHATMVDSQDCDKRVLPKNVMLYQIHLLAYHRIQTVVEAQLLSCTLA